MRVVYASGPRPASPMSSARARTGAQPTRRVPGLGIARSMPGLNELDRARARSLRKDDPTGSFNFEVPGRRERADADLMLINTRY